MSVYIAKAIVVKVSVGGATGNRVARVLRAGDVVPEGVTEVQLERLVERGLIEKVADEKATSDEVEVPEGDPTEKWTAPQLKKYAADNGIDLGSAKNKGDVLAAIAAAKAASTPPAGPAGD